MDFVSDALMGGDASGFWQSPIGEIAQARRLKWIYRCLEFELCASLKKQRLQESLPKRIKADNGPQFKGHMVSAILFRKSEVRRW